MAEVGGQEKLLSFGNMVALRTMFCFLVLKDLNRCREH
jgi:hypothetical protein